MDLNPATSPVEGLTASVGSPHDSANEMAPVLSSATASSSSSPSLSPSPSPPPSLSSVPISVVRVASAVVRTPLKRFSHAQIAEKVRERSGSVADYYSLLMSSAVKEDDQGVVFDSTAKGWKELVRRCEEADGRQKEKNKGKSKTSTSTLPPSTADSTVPSAEPTPHPHPPPLPPPREMEREEREREGGKAKEMRDRDREVRPLSSSPIPSVAVSSPSPPPSVTSSSSFFSKMTRIIASSSSAVSTRPTPSSASSSSSGGGDVSGSRGGSSLSEGVDETKEVSHKVVGLTGSLVPPAPRSVNFRSNEGPAVAPSIARAVTSPTSSSEMQKRAAAAQQQAARRAAKRATAPPPSVSSFPSSSSSPTSSSSLFPQSSPTVAASIPVSANSSAPATSSSAVVDFPSTSSTSTAQSSSSSSSSSSSISVRTVRSIGAAVHRPSAAQIRRSATREVKDSAQVQADVAFEERIRREVDGIANREEVEVEWRERRRKEMEREAERKRKDEEEELRRVQAGGKKRRKIAIPPPPVIRLNGAVLEETEFLSALFTLLDAKEDKEVDWTLVKQIGAVIGLPHSQRNRVWTHLLRVTDGEGRHEEEEVEEVEEVGEVKEGRGESMSEANADRTAVTTALMKSLEGNTEGEGGSTTGEEGQGGIPSSSFSPPSSLDVNATAAASSISTSFSSSPSSPSSSIPSSSLSSPKLDLINQRVIRVDIERTLPHFVTLQRPDVRHDLEVILTAYCKAQHMTYKQGMNYLLAPFFFLRPLPLSRSDRRGLSSLYSAFIGRVLPNTFIDDEFGSLQCLFLLFRHLLLYHDPQLALHLDSHDMGPELYASSWFITLYSNRCKMEVTLFLWDLLIVDEDPLLHYFVSLALLIANRAQLLKESAVSLPELLSKLSIASKKDAYTLVQRAKRLYKANSPALMKRKLQELTSQVIRIDGPVYVELSQWPSSLVDSDEVIDALVTGTKTSSTTSPSSAIKFFVLDCRESSQYEAGHLPMSYHLDPSLLEERRGEELELRLEGVLALRGCHFCLADSPTSGGDVRGDGEGTDGSGGGGALSSSPAFTSTELSFLSLLLRRHVKFVSLISGGFPACHARILQLERSSELIDHRPDECLECNGRRAVKKEKKTLLSSMRKIGTAMMARYTQQHHMWTLRRFSPPSVCSTHPIECAVGVGVDGLMCFLLC